MKLYHKKEKMLWDFEGDLKVNDLVEWVQMFVEDHKIGKGINVKLKLDKHNCPEDLELLD